MDGVLELTARKESTLFLRYDCVVCLATFATQREPGGRMFLSF
jgi:hypothetical protein